MLHTLKDLAVSMCNDEFSENHVQKVHGPTIINISCASDSEEEGDTNYHIGYSVFSDRRGVFRSHCQDLGRSSDSATVCALVDHRPLLTVTPAHRIIFGTMPRQQTPRFRGRTLADLVSGRSQ